MIKYALRCSHDHEFEVWFNSISAYDDQQKKKLLRCPHCDDDNIDKALMAPRVVTTKGKQPATAPPGDEPSLPAPVTPSPEAHVPVVSAPPPARVVEVLRELRTFVEANTEDVGKDFAEEARKIHYEEAEPRGIRGEATAEDIEELDEEGISVAAIPKLPEDQN